MARANFQVLVIPYVMRGRKILYGTFLRADRHEWQFIAGGGEADETPIESAKRESNEEAAIPYESHYYALDTCCSISVDCFCKEDRQRWGENCFVIPEYSFAVHVEDEDFRLSQEHLEYNWLDYDSARKLLKYDSNRVALGELDARIRKGLLGTAK